ncbi:SseB family protein [Microbacterium betulae]|uniref:SseB family protein n=1 Tax=Microbacterium betulae TaxID=2981139 RepID=A0AA97I630_9MICO|nr:SseB family protein [Microbacterium sp. AB]WOF22187.1 SseB family protein [Microbacterium sp. AB]
MGLFSRKKKTDPADQEPSEPSAGAGETAESAPADESPEVGISFSAFRGVGAQSGPEVAAPSDDAATPEASPAPEAPAAPRVTRTPAPQPGPPARPALPKAPAAPPVQLETVPGLRDNALLRDALAALPEKPSGPQVMGVLRQLLQGHVFLRVKGDARQQISEGKAVTFGVARIGDKSFILAFSSGKALREAVQSDGDAATSAVSQPVSALLKQLVGGDFGGIVIDNASAPHRVVLPRDIVEQAVTQADPEFRLKSLLTAPREADTPRRVAALLAEAPPLWVAVGSLTEDDSKMGIAEARLSDGTRLVQIHSHPLEIVAQGRGEKALPIQVAKLGKMLREHADLGGVLIDPAGPLITLTRDELAPVMALGE